MVIVRLIQFSGGGWRIAIGPERAFFIWLNELFAEYSIELAVVFESQDFDNQLGKWGESCVK